MQAQGHEVMAPRIGDGGLLGVGDDERRPVGGEQHIDLLVGGHEGRLRKQAGQLLSAHGPDIGDAPAPQSSQLMRGQSGGCGGRVVFGVMIKFLL